MKRRGSSHPNLEALYDEAIRDTIDQFEATGSPVITDGEQRKYHDFATTAWKGSRIPHPMGLNCHSRMDMRADGRVQAGHFAM